MLTKKEFGKCGEDLAVSFLIKKGYKILARNIYSKYGEIDILGQLNGQIVCVEVKTRSSLGIDAGVLAITRTKIRRIMMTWYWYRSQHPKLPVFMRVEAVIIIMQDKKINYRHYLDVGFIDT